MRLHAQDVVANPYEDSPGYPGLVYRTECFIPGLTSGGTHWFVVLSTEEYAKRTGHVVVAPLRRAVPVSPSVAVGLDDIEAISLLRIDRTRALDLGQVWSVSMKMLQSPMGLVRPRVLAEVQAIIPDVFQFAGPWSARGSLAIVEDPRGLRDVVLVEHDDWHSDRRSYHVVLEYRHGNPGWLLETVLGSALVRGGRRLGSYQQQDLSRRLERIFGLVSQRAAAQKLAA